MTVIYAKGGRKFGNFKVLTNCKLILHRWKGSMYKLVLPDLSLYLILFFSVNFIFRFWLGDLPHTDKKRQWFIVVVDYCQDITAAIPLQFILGFYVSIIVTRWWSYFMEIPWPDTLAVLTATGILGHDDRGRLMRRTLLRYVNLSLALTLRMTSSQVRTRFPTLEHLVEAGFLLPHEKLIIDHLNEKLEGPKYFVPLVWASALATKARKEGRIPDEIHLYHIIKEICKFRSYCANLLNYDWVNIPLVYTQVASLATYSYFLSCLLGKQVLQTRDNSAIYFPLFHFLEFFFLFGWLKVAEIMINPFGEDDDDFEVNWLIDRNFTVSYMIVDEMNTEFPELVRDQYWENVVPEELYYTEGALRYKTSGYQGSAAVAISMAPDTPTKNHEGSSRIPEMNRRVASSAFTVPVNSYRHYTTQPVVLEEDLASLFEHSFVPKPEDSDSDDEKATVKDTSENT